MAENPASFVELTGKANVYAHEINTLPGFGRIIASVDGIERYDRVISVARPQDVAILKCSPDEDYLDWLDGNGFGTRRTIVLESATRSVLPERILFNGTRGKIEKYLGRDTGEAVFCPYYAGALEERASLHLDLPMYAHRPAVERFDSKIRFKSLCRLAGVPVVEEIRIKTGDGSKAWIRALKEVLPETGRAVIRGEFGASASTTFRFTHADEEEVKRIIAGSAPSDCFLVEPYHEKTSSPSTNWFLTRSGEIVHLRTSDQLLEQGISHAGNVFPVERGEMLLQDWSRAVAELMAGEGFIGPFGIDFMETVSGEFYVTECNPRVTGAMYPWEIVRILESRHGPVGAARSENIRLKRRGIGFRDILPRLRPWLYSGHTHLNIVFPFNTGPLTEGKFTLLTLAGSSEEALALSKKVQAELQEI